MPEIDRHKMALRQQQEESRPHALARRAAAGETVSKPHGISEARWAAMQKQAGRSHEPTLAERFREEFASRQ